MVSTIKPIYLTIVSIHKPLGYRNFCARSSPLGSTPALCCAAAAAYLPGPMKLAAVGSHYALYALMIAMPLLGWGMLSAAAYPVVLFRGWHLPAILPQSDSLHTLLWDAHFYLALAFFVLILLHIAAVGDNPCTSSALCAIGERCARIRLFRRVHLVERCRDSSECRECTAATRPGPRIGLRVRKRSPLPEMHTGSCSHCRPLSSSFYPLVPSLAGSYPSADAPRSAKVGSAKLIYELLDRVGYRCRRRMRRRSNVVLRDVLPDHANSLPQQHTLLRETHLMKLIGRVDRLA